MRLHCAHSAFPDKSRAYSVDTWVRAAIGPHLEELHLNLYSDNDGPGFKLPLSIFSCPNLVSLSICGGIDAHLRSSTTISLPSLKMMLIHLGNVEVPFVNALLCGCPNIETLELSFFNQVSDKVCFPPTLKRLKVHIKYEGGNALEINAPDLEYLTISQYAFTDVLNMHNLHNVVEAHLDLFPLLFGFVVPLIKLLSALSGTKHPSLGGSTTKVSFVEYILQKGAVLKTMIIDDISLDQSKKYDILKRLSNVPRASIMCRLAFD